MQRRTEKRKAFRIPQSKDPAWVRWLLTGLALLTLTVLVIVPVVSVFVEAFADGAWAYWDNLFGDPDTRASVLLRPVCLIGPARPLNGVALAGRTDRLCIR